MEADGRWYIGAALCFASNVLSPLGYVLQKRATRVVEGSDSGRAAPPPLSSQWLLGCGLVVLAVLLSLLSSAFTAQSILAPLSSSSLIVNMAASAALLGERVTRVDVLSSLLIIAGSTLSVVFGDHSERVFTNAWLESSFQSLATLLYAGLSSAFCLAVYAVLRYQSALTQRSTQSPHGGESRRLSGRRGLLQALLYCVLAGALGAQSDLFGKMAVELVATTAQGDQQLTSPYPYLYTAATVAFALAQIHFLSHALVLFDALYCLPLYECVEILTSTVGGALVFGELTSLTGLQLLAFVLGIASLLLGVAIMALRDVNAVRDASGGGGSSQPAPRGSVHNAATMLATLQARRWKVTRAREDEAEGRARTQRAKSQSEVELLQSKSRSRSHLERVSVAKLSPDDQGPLRLSPEVERSLLRLSRLSPHSPLLSPSSSAAAARRKASGRSLSLPASVFASLLSEAEAARHRRGEAFGSMAVLASQPPPAHRWAVASDSTAGSFSLGSSPAGHRRRATVSRALDEGLAPLREESGERALSVLAEEAEEGANSSAALAAAPQRPPTQSLAQSPTPLRVIRISRVRRTEPKPPLVD